MLLAAVGALVAVGIVFDVAAHRRGRYRGHAYYQEASKQRRAQRVNLMHSLYERRTRGR